MRNGEKLRAWDAADEYVLQSLEEYPEAETQSVLILNDHCGALSIVLAEANQFQQLQMMMCQVVGVLDRRHSIKHTDYLIIPHQLRAGATGDLSLIQWCCYQRDECINITVIGDIKDLH